jgi:hypothetical protein
MMRLRTSLAAMGAAVALGTTGALAVPAFAAGAHSGTHALKFISVTKKSIMLTKTSGAQQDTDVNAAGKTVGFDMLYFAVSATTGTEKITVDTAGGFLYGTFTINLKTGAPANGTVTGGTGAFARASGTIKIKNLNPAGTRTAIAITYRG